MSHHHHNDPNYEGYDKDFLKSDAIDSQQFIADHPISDRENLPNVDNDYKNIPVEDMNNMREGEIDYGKVEKNLHVSKQKLIEDK
jgi:hypothetical protein